MLADELVKIAGPRAVAQAVAAGMTGRMPGILGHQHIAFELVVKRRASFFLDLRVQNAIHAAVVALFAVEVAIHRFSEQPVHHLVFLFLGNQDVDIEFGAETGDSLHQFERRHLLGARAVLVVVFQGVQRVVHHHSLEVAVFFDGV